MHPSGGNPRKAENRDAGPFFHAGRGPEDKGQRKRGPLWGAFAGAFFADLHLDERAGGRNMTYERAEPSSGDKTPSAHDMRPNGVAKMKREKDTQKSDNTRETEEKTIFSPATGSGNDVAFRGQSQV